MAGHTRLGSASLSAFISCWVIEYRRADLERIVAIASDALVDRKKIEVQAVVVPLVQDRHDMRQDSGVCLWSAEGS